MLAYVCERDVGSEPEAGFNYLRAAAARHQVTVVTHSTFAAGLQYEIDDGHLPPVEIVGLATPEALRRRMGRLGAGHVDYIVWQMRARRYAERELARFDLVHHVTYGSDWMPSAALSLSGIPVVWGSVGGRAPVPWRLARYLPPTSLAVEALREIVTRGLRRWPRRQVRQSGCLVVAKNRETKEYFEASGAQVVINPHVVVLPQPATVEPPTTATPGQRHRAVFVSKLVGWKGPLLAVHALFYLDADWRLEFFGTGPAQERAQRFADRLGVADRILFHGRVPKEDVLQAMRDADVLVFPSMHDTSPMPVAEAGWAGCPVVCLDVAGPPILIQGTPGVAVQPDRHAARRLAEAIRTVRRHPPVTSWSAGRLEASVDSWYTKATAAAAG